MGYVPKDPKRAKRLREAEQKIREARAGSGRAPKQEDKIKHGLSGYTNDKCRCPVCTKAGRAYEQEYTRRLKGEGKPIRGRGRPRA
jgi:hypothetical protein